MTRQHERFRLTAVLAALAVLLGSAAFAAEPDYRATTVKPVNGKIISEETFWRCVDGQCSAQQSSDTRRLVCPKLVKKVGKIESFSFRGTPFDTAALAECNLKAR